MNLLLKVGQYLMTLPQLLEPYIMHDNPAVTVALQHGKLPYTEDQGKNQHKITLFIIYKREKEKGERYF